MVGHVCLIACLIAICIPIVSVQLPRFSIYTRLRSKFTESRPSRLSSWDFLLPHVGRRVTRVTSPLESATKVETRDSAETYDGAQSRATSRSASGEGDSTQASPLAVRKPWDPPLPQRGNAGDEGMRRKSGWKSLPPTPPRTSGTYMERAGTARRLFPPDNDGDHGDDINEDADVERENQQDLRGSKSKERAEARRGRTDTTHGLSFRWLFVSILALLLFLLGFALLVAHCLAWFLVYKTESRLGEARRGIVQGGDMRLCLCAG